MRKGLGGSLRMGFIRSCQGLIVSAKLMLVQALSLKLERIMSSSLSIKRATNIANMLMELRFSVRRMDIKSELRKKALHL